MKIRVAGLVFAAFVLGGCVTGRRVMPLPVTTQAVPAATRGTVYIASITDDRQFQNKPSDPSIPSVDGDVSKLSAHLRDQMIGRQRNAFGKAMGDIALPAGDSVTERVRLLVQEAFRRSGYSVTKDPSAANSVDVSVMEFWSWMTPGFAALTFEAKLTCRIFDHSGDPSRFILVKGYGRNYGQFAKDVNWQEAYDPAFQDFITNFVGQVAALGLGHENGTDHAAAGAAVTDVADEIRKLDQLRRSGAITNEEFETQKRRLLERQ